MDGPGQWVAASIQAVTGALSGLRIPENGR